MTNKIRVFVTGGTFDKEYNELDGTLFFKDTHLREMLELGRCGLAVETRTLMMIDSTEMTDADREIIRKNCQDSSADWRDGPVHVREFGWIIQPWQRHRIRADASTRRLHRDEREILFL